ncbi:restriction endonuclease [Rhodospirillum rubrum]|uniref:Restriction endonuclease type IV Mrr domain-containing protein n=1 Tax=Rhodospirillum rubrum (strain ATCC 11170 / ATH 1.1.1 / DSM 467 / LMG 4362 / NCIMB 8255 / S1) TaxID=269796 RepID=Q2RQT4_RHORT|nr:restriction endonuclease [Rhodospirillum rubrum]ABC23511.1 hypothetical protein Rru_A2714 [Rhodospirillum rubrum ATCC 11170]MBK5955183.1 hypothetical protein [Rhodospirillum rubrum]QXG79478.1 restriction endonuclease [Rhodospirillum rubrum]HAP98897.1 hypothetical protein [Rhodospirillum rubrum]HCF19232.1 hypothetical protein [Rhodospirillum rubrum]
MSLADLFTDETVFALKGYDEGADRIMASLRAGIGRFGWSYMRTDAGDQLGDADLRRLAKKTYAELTPDEQHRNQSFLLDIEPRDWVVYVNIPKWGQCTLAQVTSGYFWDTSPSDDFNHCFRVDPETVRSFDRNAQIVPTALAQRLKLQGRYWRIYAKAEFKELLAAVDTVNTPMLRTPISNAAYLAKKLEPALLDMTRLIQRTNPNYDLEKLLELIFSGMAGVKRVVRQGGAGDHGADLIVEFETGLSHPAFQYQHICIIQVKSFVGGHNELQAVEDLRRAFKKYPAADMGLIFSTADSANEHFEAELSKLRDEDPRRKIELIIGADVARFIIKFGSVLEYKEKRKFSS